MQALLLIAEDLATAQRTDPPDDRARSPPHRQGDRTAQGCSEIGTVRLTSESSRPWRR